MTAQESIDNYYLDNNKTPCCAGCDYWRFHNSRCGECTKTPPVSEDERIAMLGIRSCSLKIGAGHIFTTRDHSCGGFVDSHEWGI